MKKIASNITRREFLGQASCRAIGSASLFSALLNLRMANSAAAQNLSSVDPFEYRALVCLYLHGGLDSYNMLLPRGEESHAAYQTTRTDLAIDKELILPLNDLSGKELGIHPSMAEVQQIFDAERLIFVANVGTLVEPTSLSQYQNKQVPLPRGLYSHRDQMQQWQTSIPDGNAAVGWGGRTADLLASLNDSDKISMNISLNGNNIWQSGATATSFQISKSGSIKRSGYDSVAGQSDAMVGAAIDSQLDLDYANLFKQTFVDISRSAIDAHEEFSSATDAVAPFVATVYTDPLIDSEAEISAINSLAGYFTMVAKSIAAHGTFGLRRQTFFVQYGGWDHHDDLLEKQEKMLKVLSRCLKYFDDLMLELGMGDKVTLFTESEFARTLNSNGDGSDHGWGGNHIVMGGAVNGREIYGAYPDLYSGSSLDTGRGRLIPSLSVDEYFAELALWFGVSPSDLSTVLPNIDRFYQPGSGAPVGFLQV